LFSSKIEINGYEIAVFSYNTVIVGTGAAGFNAANRLYGYGQRDIAMVTDHILAGTSRNTGSDKQTYYKLTLAGNVPDSVAELTRVLFAGQCVDGDLALAEAALSVKCFLNLAELGVPFPQNRYGEYIGYKTDHDPGCRATSAGPYTSKMMTECLERAVNEKRIRIYDHRQVIKIFTAGAKVCGLLCLNLQNTADKTQRFTAFICKNIVYATGGPAGMYADSVYPLGHYGATGLAFEAGVAGKNLTEWQYGLASLKPRWNVSGSYMQVLPKFISTDASGGDKREFLCDFFADKGEMLTKVFLKGYQWPFDVRKVAGGSSIIDLLVYVETCLKGRRIFLDFRANPGNEAIDYAGLADEAREYLERAGAVFGTPIERLQQMNAPAVNFYRDKGVDLSTEPLEIALCAQHNNGGLAIDAWWQTNVQGFFAAGEVSGSHGVYRPGGSALNAGQVGSTRAAQYIAHNCQGEPLTLADFQKICHDQLAKTIKQSEAVIGDTENVRQIWDEATRRMSRCGAAIRSREGIRAARAEIAATLSEFEKKVKIKNIRDLSKVFRLYDTLICQSVYLGAMDDYIKNGGKSRGSALYSDEQGNLIYQNLPEMFRFTLDDGSRSDLIQEVLLHDGECAFTWRQVREIPESDDFFENVWRSYREHGNVY
jgi:succinate dehydrogenase/fumarate reductase flavoprotein subunit